MKESRSKKAIFNTAAGFSLEIVQVICGLILPRLILSNFGSAYNGITSSISQFISCISLMKAGIGGVTRAALYKPLAENDTEEISQIFLGTERFMRSIALLFCVCVVAFAAVYPIWINTEFDWLFTFSLILIISVSTFVQYYFGLTYQMLLNADQRQGVTSIVQIISNVLNTLIAAVLIRYGASIHVVKLGSAAAFAINPIIISNYARKRYKIDRKAEPRSDRIKQRWDAVGHEVAGFVNTNTDIMVLTIFAGIKEVSVYTVYAYVTTAIHKVVNNFVLGFGAAFGNMYARREYALMHENLGIFELIVFSVSAIVYSVTLVMITPFVLLYTSGVTDVSYNRPLFGILITLASASTCFRIPYVTITTAVGHYRQTRNGAFFEAALNIFISVVCVKRYGIIGVTIGTLTAALFRSCQYSYYLSKNILRRSTAVFALHVIVCFTIMALTYLASTYYMTDISTVPLWIGKAVVTTLVAVALTILTDLLFWKRDLFRLISKLKMIIRKTKNRTVFFRGKKHDGDK